MKLYHIGALTKIVIGLVILLVLYTQVNILQDLAIGLIFLFLGIFLVARGLSFYGFLAVQQLRSKQDQSKQFSLSYKLSLLFGMFVLLNTILFISEFRTKILGFIVFVIFILLHLVVINESK